MEIVKGSGVVPGKLLAEVNSPADLKKLKEYADDIQDRVEALPEISGVDIIGALDPEIQINVDMNKMAAAQISFTGKRNAVALVI